LSGFDCPKVQNLGQLNPYMPLEQLEGYVAWPGDKFYYTRADPTNEAQPSTIVDEDFTKLDDFLRK